MAVLFTINLDGTPSNVGNGVYTLQDQEVVSCVVRTFWSDFPKPEGGTARVAYNIYFASPKK